MTTRSFQRAPRPPDTTHYQHFADRLDLDTSSAAEELSVPNSSAERVDIGRYARQAVANGWIVVLIVAAIGGTAYVRAKSQRPVYASSAVVRVFDPSDAAVGGATPYASVDPAREVDDQVLYAQSPGVWSEATRRLGPDTARSIDSHAVVGSADSDTIQLTTESTNRESARTRYSGLCGRVSRATPQRNRAAL